MWYEGEVSLEASEFTTLLTEYLSTLSKTIEIVIHALIDEPLRSRIPHGKFVEEEPCFRIMDTVLMWGGGGLLLLGEHDVIKQQLRQGNQNTDGQSKCCIRKVGKDMEKQWL